ncbi:MAG: efflux RND transporter periplasmic adaptor subunit [Caldilineaceae bacterium]|nr:efflux RND transporter periplasmic adaptor subunit [Caldilineaceae bacterium]MBP8109859.1 efflux RND transporter periplasmic adaptor subunit [Caldilineaceae bacterium]MBP9074769.1 efflux RND transporter periplasmic adaptor subunit [Caldilineaceae bacterium]
MPKMKAQRKKRSNGWWWVILPLLAIAGGAYYYFQVYMPTQTVAAAPTMKTAKVRKGDITVSASAAGVIIAPTEMDLAFSSSGRLVELLVAEGDMVQAGDVLAKLDDSDLRINLLQAESNLAAAKLKMADLQDDVDPIALSATLATVYTARENLSQSENPASAADLAAARANLNAARQALSELYAGPSTTELTILGAELEKATIALQRAQSDYNAIAWRNDIGTTPQSAALQQATIDFDRANAAYALSTAPASSEAISSANARVASAEATLERLLLPPSEDATAALKAKVDQAEAELAQLMAGANPADIESAQIAIAQASAGVDGAKLALERATLIAPFDGTITAVNGQVGENVTTSPLLTITDMQNLAVELYVEESDMGLISPGNVVNISLQANGDAEYYGAITHVSPLLVMIDGVPALRAQATIENPPAYARPGMTASLKVIAATANNALLVSLEALRELSPGSYAVFVVENGVPLMRPVEVGIMDFANAEILSGLSLGEVVSTGIIETQ